MSMALVFLVTMVLFETQSEVELFIWESDFGWGLPIPVRVWWRRDLLGGDEEGRKFLFRCGEHDELDDFGERGEWYVVGWDRYVFGRKYVSSLN